MDTDKNIEILIEQDHLTPEQYTYCPSCSQIKRGVEFFTFKDNKNRDWICKECRLKEGKDYDIHTYNSLFKLYDIPYIYKEWEYLVQKNIAKSVIENKPYTSIFGKYFAKMRLKGFRCYGYEDSGFLNRAWEVRVPTVSYNSGPPAQGENK